VAGIIRKVFSLETGASVMERSRIVKRSISIRGHKTSVSMEKEFWDILLRIRAAEMSTLSALVERIHQAREHGNLSSAIRLYILKYVEQEGGK
jgi:predicted DNA-binding ribbon-helix-helix protein